MRFVLLLDWVIALMTLAWGIWSKSPWIIASGLIGVCIAWFKPAVRVQSWVKSKFVKKDAKIEATHAALASEALYEQILADQQSQAEPTADDFRRSIGWGSVTLASSRHNRLNAASFTLTPLQKSNANVWR